jgi:hypothetical protein
MFFYVCMCAHAPVRMFDCVCACMFVCAYILFWYAFACVCFACNRTYVCMHACTLLASMCMYTCTHMHIHVKPWRIYINFRVRNLAQVCTYLYRLMWSVLCQPVHMHEHRHMDTFMRVLVGRCVGVRMNAWNWLVQRVNLKSCSTLSNVWSGLRAREEEAYVSACVAVSVCMHTDA